MVASSLKELMLERKKKNMAEMTNAEIWAFLKAKPVSQNEPHVVNYNASKAAFVEGLDALVKSEDGKKGCWSKATVDNLKAVLLAEPSEGHPEESIFQYAPAAAKYHCNTRGGLLIHSYDVYLKLKWLTDSLGLEWERPESPFIIAMFHDLVKTKCYETFAHNVKDDKTGKWNSVTGYRTKQDQKELYNSHGAQSVEDLEDILLGNDKLTHEEKACIINHMGPGDAPDTISSIDYGNACSAFRLVQFVHLADAMAAQSEPISDN
jgi:hypothetical protein